MGRSFMECTASIDLLTEQGLVDLLGEQPLAAEVAQRLVADAVA